MRLEDYDILEKKGVGISGIGGSGFGWGSSRFTQGFQGGVFTAVDKLTKEKVAIKIIPKNYQDPRFQKEINNEINSLKTIKNENSLKYYTHFEDNGYYYIVTELCDSDLKKYVEKEHNYRFTSEEIREIFSQLNNVFREMRKYNIMHRDLKLANILIKNLENGKKLFKLGDFGKSRVVVSYKPEYYEKTLIGDLSIKAPELCKGGINEKQLYDEKCDLWSIGVMMHHIYFQHLPPMDQRFDFREEYSQYYNFLINNVRNSRHMAPQLKDLMLRLLVVDPTYRISWNEYFNHPFFTNNGNQDMRYSKIYDFNLDFSCNMDLFDCFIAKDSQTNKNVLIKSYKTEFIENINNKPLFENEIYLFKQFKGNKNVLNLIDEYFYYDRVNYVFEFNDFEMLSIYSKKNEMNEKEIKKINKILFENVLILNEKKLLLFNCITIHSFCIDKYGNPLLFDFGFNKLFLSYEELSIYFYPNPSELNLYSINPIIANVMNYGMTLLLLFCKNDFFKCRPYEIIFPNNISDEFKKFLEICLNKNCNDRALWEDLKETEFIKNTTF